MELKRKQKKNVETEFNGTEFELHACGVSQWLLLLRLA